MRRLFLPAGERLADTVTLTGQDAHHVGYTLRARRGDRCTVVDEARAVASMEVADFTADTVTLRLVERLEADTEPPIDVTLAMCLPKADKMDMIVQKATELGAACVQPLKSAHCVVKYDEKKAAQRQEKWQRVATEASKQCGRTVVPRVAPIMAFGDFLRALPQDTALCMAYEAESSHTLRAWLRAQEAHVASYAVIVGPEGGFSPEEAAAAEAAGVSLVTLGRRILRAETAALATLAAVMYEKGDW